MGLSMQKNRLAIYDFDHTLCHSNGKVILFDKQSGKEIKQMTAAEYTDVRETNGWDPKTQDFNTGDNYGCGYFQVTEKNGFRCSTAVGYLNPIKNRKNLSIITNAHVKKINFENKTAKEVEYWQGSELKKVISNKEIILSSGSIGSCLLYTSPSPRDS